MAWVAEARVVCLTLVLLLSTVHTGRAGVDVTLQANDFTDANGVLHNQTFAFVVTFSQAVAGFDASDVTLGASDNSLRFSPTGLQQVSATTWLVSADVLAWTPSLNKTTVTARVEPGVVVPTNNASTTLSCLYGPPTPVITASGSANNNTIVFVAQFVEAWHNTPRAVDVLHPHVWNIAVVPAAVEVAVVHLLRTTSSSWELALRVAPPLQPNVTSVTVHMDAMPGGAVPLIARSASVTSFQFVPPVAAVTVRDESGVDVTTSQGADTRAVTFVAAINAPVQVVSAGVWDLGFSTYLAGAVATTSLQASPSTATINASVVLPQGLLGAGLYTVLDGDAASPNFVSPPHTSITYACPVSPTSSCVSRRVVLSHNPGSPVSLFARDFSQMPALESGLSHRWSARHVAPAPGFEPFVMTNATSAAVLSLPYLPPGSFAFACTWTRQVRSAHWASAVVEVDVYNLAGLRTHSTTPLRGGDDLQLAWTSVLPSSAHVSLTVDHQEAGTVLHFEVLSAATTSTAVSIPMSTPSGTLRVRLRPLAPPDLAGTDGVSVAASMEQTLFVAVASPLSYAPGPWSACSTPCGVGTQLRTLTCHATLGSVAVPVAAALCTVANLTQPVTQRSCNAGVCSHAWWRVGGWGSCSATCGGGTQLRVVECADAVSNAVVDSRRCSDSKPPQEWACNSHPCDSFSWATSAWSACSAGCGPSGSGQQLRSVWCVNDHTLAAVGDSHCAGQTAPTVSQDCSPEAPSCASYHFEPSEWGACSVECGGGVASRQVTCYLGTTPQAGHSACIAAGLSVPTTTRACGMVPCYDWRVSAWGECSKACASASGTGFHTRDVSCIRRRDGAVVDAGLCKRAGSGTGHTLATTRRCNADACAAVFCTGNVCNHHGTCNATALRCVCDDGWSGEYCGTPPNCSSGQVFDVSGNCCAGVLSPNGTCCSSGTIDASGVCCDASMSALDGCGRCADPANTPAVITDAGGTCCAVSAVAEDGLCCVDLPLDACRVCGGRDLCRTTHVLTLTSATVALDNATAMLGAVVVPLLETAVAIRLANSLRSDTVVTVTNAGVYQDEVQRRRRLTSTIVATLVLEPGSLPPSPHLRTAIAQQLPSMQVTSADGTILVEVASVGDTVLAPVCGNGVCEAGEACTTTGSDLDGCCLSDCGRQVWPCPQPSTASGKATGQCSGRGVCEHTSGSCVCFDGYTGAACEACAIGYSRTGDNMCNAVATLETVTALVLAPASSPSGSDNGGGSSGTGSDGGANDDGGTGVGGSGSTVAVAGNQDQGFNLGVAELFSLIIAVSIVGCTLACICYCCCVSGTAEQPKRQAVAPMPMMPMMPFSVVPGPQPFTATPNSGTAGMVGKGFATPPFGMTRKAQPPSRQRNPRVVNATPGLAEDQSSFFGLPQRGPSFGSASRASSVDELVARIAQQAAQPGPDEVSVVSGVAMHPFPSMPPNAWGFEDDPVAAVAALDNSDDDDDSQDPVAAAAALPLVDEGIEDSSSDGSLGMAEDFNASVRFSPRLRLPSRQSERGSSDDSGKQNASKPRKDDGSAVSQDPVALAAFLADEPHPKPPRDPPYGCGKAAPSQQHTTACPQPRAGATGYAHECPKTLGPRG